MQAQLFIADRIEFDIDPATHINVATLAGVEAVGRLRLLPRYANVQRGSRARDSRVRMRGSGKRDALLLLFKKSGYRLQI